MNVTDISRMISKDCGMSMKEVSAVIMKFMDKSNELIYQGHEVKIKGFVSMKLEVLPEVNKYNFEAKRTVTLPKRYDLKINPSPDFLRKIKNKPLG